MIAFRCLVSVCLVVSTVEVASAQTSANVTPPDPAIQSADSASMDCGQAFTAEKYADAAVACIGESILGVPGSQFILGAMYLSGKGVEKDEAKALEQFRMAAENGMKEAQFVMGRLSEEGRLGLPKDPDAALKWYQAAAKQGHAEAQAKLKKMPQSSVYELANAEGHGEAGKAEKAASIECSYDRPVECDYRGLFKFLPPKDAVVMVDGSRLMAKVDDFEFSVEVMASNSSPERFTADLLDSLRAQSRVTDLSQTLETESVANGSPTTMISYCAFADDGAPRKEVVVANPMSGQALVRKLSGPATPGCTELAGGDEKWASLANSFDALQFTPPFKQRLVSEASPEFLERAAKDPSGRWVVSRSVGVRVHEAKDMNARVENIRTDVPALIAENKSTTFVAARWPASMTASQVEYQFLLDGSKFGCVGTQVEKAKETFRGHPAQRLEFVVPGFRCSLITTADTNYTLMIFSQGSAKWPMEDRFEFVN